MVFLFSRRIACHMSSGKWGRKKLFGNDVLRVIIGLLIFDQITSPRFLVGCCNGSYQQGKQMNYLGKRGRENVKLIKQKMNQLIKILLDHPDKIERFFLWFLQSAIIFWGISFFMGYNILQITSVDGSLEFNFTGQLLALRLATYLLIFAISWIIIWGLLADLLILISFRAFNWIIRQIRVILWYIFLSIFYPVILALSIFTIINKPRPFWKSTKKDEDAYKTNDFHAKTRQLTKDLEFFFELNNWTKSAKGSELLLEIISFEKGEFFRSRMIRW